MPVVVGDRHFCFAIGDADRPIEARAAPGMAGGIVAGHRDFQPNGVLVAIGSYFPDGLQIARAFALLPEAVA